MIGAIIAKHKTREKFAARNRGDIDTFLDNWAEDATFIFPGQSEMSGTLSSQSACCTLTRSLVNNHHL